MAALNDEQTMLRDMVREWADKESPVTAFRKLRAAAPAEGYDPTAWNALSEMGLPGIVIPEEFGGTAFGYLSLGLVLEQLGRNLAASPLASTAAAASAIVLGGSDAAKIGMAAEDRQRRRRRHARDRRRPGARSGEDRYGRHRRQTDGYQGVRCGRRQRGRVRGRGDQWPLSASQAVIPA